MIFYFSGALLMSAALLKLGSYMAIIAMIETATKVTLGLLAVIAAVLLLRKFRGMPRMFKPQALTHKA